LPVAGIAYIIGFALFWVSFLASEHRVLIESLVGTIGLASWSISPVVRTTLFASGLVCLGIGYLFLLRWAFHKNVTSSRIRQARLFVAFLLFLFLILPPFLSTDVISYYQQGWVVAYQKANPYLNSPGDFTNPPGKDLLYKGYNLYALTPYGPLWTALEGGIYRMSNGSLSLGIIFFKIFAAVASLILIFTAAKITRILSPKHELVVMIFLGAHPLLLVEGPGMAHLDVMALAMVALGIWLQMHFRGKTWIGALFLMIAVLLKAYAIPALFLFFWWLARNSKPIKSRFWSIIQAMIPIVVLFVVTSIPYITGLSDIPRLFGLTVPKWVVPFTPVFVLEKILSPAFKLIGFSFSENIIGNLAQGFAIFLAVALILYFILHVRTLEALSGTLGPVYMIVNMAFSYWRPWYALWPLALIAISPHRKWGIVIATYGWLALCTYLVTQSSGISLFYK